jgi:hypothetical protein
MRVVRRFRLPALAAVAMTFAAPQAFAAGDWEWYVAPYIWAAGISTDLSVDQPPVNGSNDDSFSDVVDKLDGVFQAHVEGQNEQWGMFGDITYLGLASEEDRPAFRTETDTDLRLFELAAVWSPGEGRYQGWDLFGGLRYVDIDFSADFDPANPAFADSNFKFGESYSDFMLGARYTIPMSDRWSLTLRGDGSWGDTDGTFGASAMFAWKGDMGAWLFGYRYLSGEFKRDDADLDITLSGIQVGYGFRF